MSQATVAQSHPSPVTSSSVGKIAGSVLRVLTLLFILATYAFLLAPIFVVILMSFNSALYLSFPIQSFSLRWYQNFFADPNYQDASMSSLIVSLTSVLLATIIGTMAAYALQRYRPPFHNLINVLILSPLLLPGVVIGLSLLYTLSLVNLERSLIAVVIGHMLYVLPFVVVTVTSALQSCDRQLEEVAMSLGANEWRVFRSITFPLILPGIVSGALFALILSLDEFIITFLLGGVHVTTLPIRIFSNLKFAVDPTIAAVSTIFMVVTTVLFSLALQIRRQQGNASATLSEEN